MRREIDPLEAVLTVTLVVVAILAMSQAAFWIGVDVIFRSGVESIFNGLKVAGR